MDLRRNGETLPVAAYVDGLMAEIMTAVRRGIPQPDAAGRLVEHFMAAGAPSPAVFCERPAAAGSSALPYRWVAISLAVIRSLSNPDGEPVDHESLEAEIGAEMLKLRSQMVLPDQCCACRTGSRTGAEQ
jgi:hypothetical protein